MTQKISIEATRLVPDSEVESAKILFQEGLFEEAKKLLFQVLIQEPAHRKARVLLDQIQNKEEQLLLNSNTSKSTKKTATENQSEIIEQLNSDLGLELDAKHFDPEIENWHIETSLLPRERYDLGVAFFEMGCFKDAMRELKIAERCVRLEQTFLGEFGVSVVALYSECLVELGRTYEAKSYLEPILNEPDLKLEEKLVLFYVMGRVEHALGNSASAKGWFQKVLEVEPNFRDSNFRLAQIK